MKADFSTSDLIHVQVASLRAAMIKALLIMLLAPFLGQSNADEFYSSETPEAERAVQIFGKMLRDEQDALQAPQLSANPGWARGFDDHPAKPISQDCWNRLADARVSIIAARMTFETAQSAPGAYQSSLVAEGNKRLKEARTFLALASDCYAGAQAALANLKREGTTGMDGDGPAASSLIQANAIAGQIIEDLRFVFGADEIDRLSRPQSHGQNALTATQLAISEYLTTGALGAAARRLTKGQMNNFIGGVGQKIMQDLFPESIPQAIINGRRVDLFDRAKGIIREVKTGGFDLTSSRILEELAKDAALVRAGYRVEWWNVRSPFRKQSFSQELIQALQAAGITVVSHINP